MDFFFSATNFSYSINELYFEIVHWCRLLQVHMSLWSMQLFLLLRTLTAGNQTNC